MKKIAYAPILEKDSKDDSSFELIQFMQDSVKDSIIKAGGECAPIEQADALIWLSTTNFEDLISILDSYPNIKWVQLFYAGIDNFFFSGVLERDILFTKAKAIYASEVAQHSLALIFGVYSNLKIHSVNKKWYPTNSQYLVSKNVTIIGAGSNAEFLVKYLKPFDCDITIVRRSDKKFKNLNTIQLKDLESVLPITDILVYCAPLTHETKHLLDYKKLSMLPKNAILVNVGRGACVVTDDLIKVLEEKLISGAGLDVTDPEPLPKDNPLWQFDDVIITSHSANSEKTIIENFSILVFENVKRFVNNQELLGVVDKESGY